jgi:hypothetical protein
MQRDEEATELSERREPSLGKRLALLWVRWRRLRHWGGFWQVATQHWCLSTCRDATLVLSASSVLLFFWFYCLIALSQQLLSVGCIGCVLVLVLIERLQLCVTRSSGPAERTEPRQKNFSSVPAWSRFADAAEKRLDGLAVQPERNIHGTPLETP